MELALGESLPAATARPGLRGPEPWWRRFWALVSEVAVWREVLYLLLLLPAGIVLFVAAVTFWSVALTGVTAPLWYWAVPDADFLWNGNSFDHPVEFAGTFAVGVAALLAAPWVVHGLVRVQVMLLRALLGPTRGELERSAARSEAGRTSAVAADATHRRRIERDLHDGAQARLVGLAVDLGRARERLEAGADTAEATELVRAAHEEAKIALSEVRDLARGIHPAILADRGSTRLCRRSPRACRCPSTSPCGSRSPCRWRWRPRPTSSSPRRSRTPRVTPAPRGSRSTSDARATRSSIEVRDDGSGGAVATAGSGLAGLRERVAALGGVLVVDSPAGGPTIVKAVIPCA